MTFKHLLPAAICAASALTTWAKPAAEPVPADSASAAFATVMAQYIKLELQRDFGNDTTAVCEFVRGVAHAFDIRDVDAPYQMGVRNGLALIDRIDGMQAAGFPITPKDFADALQQALEGQAMGFTGESADAWLRDAMNRLHPYEAPAPADAEAQKAFLNAQAAREGVQTLPSGLLFEVITEGEGASPTAADRVNVTYKGALADGTVFDQTERPIQFPVNGLVPGFSEGLQLMKPGGTYRLFIPAELGYGNRGAADVIPPGAALDFTVTLLDVIPANK